ncbi:MAG: hypothetical protein U0K91_02295 [Acutalibacteraceae bacterium]|nr:hypothetical protein [Acutalibacteraceae bacterium]
MRDRLIEEPNYCDYCCNFDKEHIGMDGMAVCKLTNKIVYSEDGGDCPFFNVPKEGIIVPPCKVGDTVYAYCEYFGILQYLVENFHVGYMGKEENYLHWEAAAHAAETDELLDDMDFDLDDIGKYVFFTQEEAERTLEGRKEE